MSERKDRAQRVIERIRAQIEAIRKRPTPEGLAALEQVLAMLNGHR